MKLELKHLAPYLPYGLKVSKIHTLHAEPGIGNINQIIRAVNKGMTQYKPILLPLSDLTKPIGGHSLLTVITHKFFGYGSDYFSEPEFNVINENGFFGYQNDTNGIYFVKQEYDLGTDTYFTHTTKFSNVWTEHKVTHQLEMFEELFKNHFDVFGLIDAGLAIDINQTNPDQGH